jgi:uncharacterized membrane protein
MSNANKVVISAIAGLIALSSTSAFAAERKMPTETEKCAGVTKAGGNDCGTSYGGCHGSATVDGNDEAWIELPKGTCERLVNGYVTKSPYAIPGGKEAYEEQQRKAKK